uniref:Uncharacterized protein n=1 Tax=Aegilops tauschii subsp. strangulata TaxID=200361 RepID=A0A453MLQ2_AEGTS
MNDSTQQRISHIGCDIYCMATVTPPLVHRRWSRHLLHCHHLIPPCPNLEEVLWEQCYPLLDEQALPIEDMVTVPAPFPPPLGRVRKENAIRNRKGVL